jgi:DNA polymerase (family 10)
MSTNSEVAEIFRAIADLLDLQGERFKPEAYRRAARSVEALGEDLRAVAERGALGDVPGVGDALRDKILEYLKDGHVGYYERLRATFPPGLLELMRLAGVGPKTTRRLYNDLKVDSPAALLAAIDAGRLVGLAGFGERKIAKLREAVQAEGPGAERRTPLWTAWSLARSIVRALGAGTPTRTIDVAGSLRRRRETVGDLDILATSGDPGATVRAFVALPGVREVVLQGDTKATVRYAPGIQVDLRVVDPESFGAALQYFTGSKDHNVHLRTIAREHGLKVNEYGVYRGEARIAGRTEEEVYGALGLPWIPPELRENRGEIEAALEGRLPTLVDRRDVRGDLHRHVAVTVGVPELARLAKEAESAGLSYVGIVVPTPAESSAEAISGLRERARHASPNGPRLLVGLEVPVDHLASDPEAIPAADYVVAAALGRADPPSPEAVSRSPLFVGHISAEGPGDDSAEADLDRWIAWARAAGAALEVTPDGAADGLDSAGVRRVLASGGTVALSGGGEGFDGLEIAVGLARRGAAPAASVLNARADPTAAGDPAGPGPLRRSAKG